MAPIKKGLDPRPPCSTEATTVGDLEHCNVLR